MPNKKVIVDIRVEVPFESYKSVKLNKTAVRSIIKWIKGTLINGISFVPLYVEKNSSCGSYIEDCSKKTKIKIKSVELHSKD